MEKSSLETSLINQITLDNLEPFFRLYDLRKVGTGNSPIIHGGLISYGMFHDIKLDYEIRLALLLPMTKIALNEQPRFIHIALFALTDLIPDDRISNRPPNFGVLILELREKIKRYSFIDNVTNTWERFVTKARCLKPNEPDVIYEVSIRELVVSDSAYLEFFPESKTQTTELLETECPISIENIIEEGGKTCYAGVTCKLVYSTNIEDTKWWIFRCFPKVKGFLWIGYVYVCLNENNDLKIGHWTSHVHAMAQSQIHREVLELQFSLEKG